MADPSAGAEEFKPSRGLALFLLAFGLFMLGAEATILQQRREVPFPAGFPHEVLKMRVDRDAAADRTVPLLIEPSAGPLTIAFASFKSVNGHWAGTKGEATLPGTLEEKLECEASRKTADWGDKLSTSGDGVEAEPRCTVRLPDLTAHTHKPITLIATMEVEYPRALFTATVRRDFAGRHEVAPGGFKNDRTTVRTELPIFVASAGEIALKKRHDSHLMRMKTGLGLPDLVFSLMAIGSLALAVGVWRAASRSAAEPRSV